MSDSFDTLLRKPLPPRRGTSQWLRRALVFAAVVVLVNAVAGDGGLLETLRARREYARALATLEALQRDNVMLGETVHRLSGDARAIESIAREELGFIRPGEVLFVLASER
jgi:cell division protein FtsB